MSDVKRLEASLRDSDSSLRREMDELLEPEEVEIFLERVARFRKNPCLPTPEEYRVGTGISNSFEDARKNGETLRCRR